MMKANYPYYLANEASQPNTDLEVVDKYTGEIATRVAIADTRAIDKAISEAVKAANAMQEIPPYERQQILKHCYEQFEQRQQELAMALCIEAGKPIKDSRGEVTRLIDTFRIAAVKRVPIGPCSFIAPFNFPLNLAAHKIAPAIAAGCPFVLKPASTAPVGALLIGEILSETNLPKGAYSILPCHRDGADLFTTDERFKLLSFTGSPEIGWQLKSKAGKKKVTLELGGNAACIVDEDADLEDATDRLITGAFYQSGQSCISVQRILVHEAIYDAFRDKLVAKSKALKLGDPKEEDTFIGPVISTDDGQRLKDWIDEAIAAGGKLLCGGGQEGAMVEATLLEDVPPYQKICAKEAFGPVAVLSRFNDFNQAIRQVNDSAFGLQAGVFTRDLYKMLNAWDKLHVGGVIIGDVPSWRVDNMPYGGVKDSGLGREGVRYAIEDMTEMRLLVIREKNRK